MAIYTCKNRMEDGGNRWVIGGILEILSGAKVEGLAKLDGTIIANDLVTDDANQVLSAAQGYVLNALVGAVAARVAAEVEPIANPDDLTMDESSLIAVAKKLNELLTELKEVGLMAKEEA